MRIKPHPCNLTTQWNFLHCLKARRQPWSHERTLWKSMGCHGCQVRSVWAHSAGSAHVPAFGCCAVEHSNGIHSVREIIHWTHDGVLSQRLLLNPHCLSWVDIYFQLLLWRSTLLPLLLIWCSRMAWSCECVHLRRSYILTMTGTQCRKIHQKDLVSHIYPAIFRTNLLGMTKLDDSNSVPLHLFVPFRLPK